MTSKAQRRHRRRNRQISLPGASIARMTRSTRCSMVSLSRVPDMFGGGDLPGSPIGVIVGAISDTGRGA